MNRLTTMLIAAALLCGAAIAEDECERPWPANVPKSADSKQQMLEVQRGVKDYLAQANAFLECNEAKQLSLTEDSDDVRRQLQVLVNHYNSTVDEMHTVGEQYNALVRAFKASQADADGDGDAGGDSDGDGDG